MRAFVAAGCLLAICSWGLPAQGQTIDSKDVKFRVLGRVQAQFSTTSVDENELIALGRPPLAAIPASMFETRRIRFGAEATFKDWLTGKLETEVGMARLQIRDAFLNMAFDPALQLRIGQFKKPFSLLQLTSSSVWPVIERGVRIRGLAQTMLVQDSLAGGTPVLSTVSGIPIVGEEQDMLDLFLYQNFDLGATIGGKLGDFAYTVGVFNGAGFDRQDDTDDKSYAGRLTYTLPTSYPVTLGGAFSFREQRTASRPTIQTVDGTAFEADVEIGAFRKEGIHVLAEVAFGDNLYAADESFFGVQGIAAYFLPLDGRKLEGLEFAGRVSYGDPRDAVDEDEGLLVTPGVNLYFFGRNRLMFNWDFWSAGDRFESENALRAQAQFYF
jgi:hypothetical protein